MKKLLLAAAIAASPMVMSAEVVNPKELTEKQEEWLDKHRKGHRAFGRDWDNHGVLGSIFWIRVDDKYYSTRLKDLRTKQDREGFVAQIEAAELAEQQVVIDYVNKSIEINKIEKDMDAIEKQIEVSKEIVKLQEKIVSLQETLEIVGNDHDKLAAKLQAEIDELKDDITDLEKELATTKGDLGEANATITVSNGNISELEAKVSGLETDLAKAKKDLANANAYNVVKDSTISELETKVSGLETDLATAKEDLAEANATITVRDGTITELETKVSGLETDLATVKKNNDTYVSNISALEAEQAVIKDTVKPFLINDEDLDLESLSVAEQVQMTIELNTILIEHLETELKGVKDAKKEVEADLATAKEDLAEANIKIGELQEALGDYANAQEAYDAGVASVDITSDNEEVIEQALKDAREAALETLEDKLEDLNISVSGYTEPTVNASASSSHSWGTGQNMYLGSISVKDNNGKYITYNFDGDSANDTWYQINLGELSAISKISQAEIDTILAVAEAAYKHGYKDGYNDGYKEGYADGYEQGFTDGVNSVK